MARGRGPNTTPPPRRCDRIRAGTGAAGALLPEQLAGEPETSLRPSVLWVPARRLASCQLTMRARMSARTGRPKIASSSVDLAGFLVLKCGHRALHDLTVPLLFAAARHLALAPRHLPPRPPRSLRPRLPQGPSVGSFRRQVPLPSAWRQRPAGNGASSGTAALDRVAHQHPATFGARHRALDQDQAALLVDRDDLPGSGS